MRLARLFMPLYYESYMHVLHYLLLYERSMYAYSRSTLGV